MNFPLKRWLDMNNLIIGKNKDNYDNYRNQIDIALTFDNFR